MPLRITHDCVDTARDSKMGTRCTMPGWILAWFYVTALICTWDAAFIFFRPLSLPGGSLAHIWYLYKYYITVDQRYGDLKDDFVFAVSTLNLVEVVLNILAIMLHYRKSRHTIPLAFTVTLMTFWKTVLYFVIHGASDTYRKDNTLTETVFIFLIPNGVWIVIPFVIIVQLWGNFLPSESNVGVPNTRIWKTKAS